MLQDTTTARVSETGRISLPAKQRKLVGLEDGGLVVLRVQDGEIRIQTAKAAVQKLQDELAPYLAASGFSVDQFLAERHQEAERDEA